MTPILGITASSITSSFLGDYESIATVTVGSGGAANAEFTSIPSTFQHLQIRLSSHFSGSASGLLQGLIQLNGDTAGNYSYHRLFGNGSSASSDAAANQSNMVFPWMPDDQNSVNHFSGTVIDILDYKDANKYTTVKALGGNDQNGSGIIGFVSGNWRNTNAVTSIKLLPPSPETFKQHSTFALYGIRS